MRYQKTAYKIANDGTIITIEPQKCKVCGTRLDVDSLYCAHCGSPTKTKIETQKVSSVVKYFNFAGRASRKEFWSWIILIPIVCIGLSMLLTQMVDHYFNNKLFFVFVFALVLVNSLPLLSIAIRRIHDTGNNGWCILVPIYNIILLFVKSEPCTNRWGEVPA
jgi:uncharacterized membrane protein YhaH (DUF805 family)